MKKFIAYKHLIFILFIICMFMVSSFLFVTSFILNSKLEENELEVGFVKVQVDPYFVEDGIIYREGLDYIATSEGEGTFTKFGVLKIDVSNPTSRQFLTNFRVNIIISSNVLTYFRVAPYEQLTLSYVMGSVTREVAITQKEYMPFNYNVYDPDIDDKNRFIDRREYDGFLYYMQPVQRISKSEDTVITLIGTFASQSYRLYDDRYSMQIGFIIEAVQAYQGPQENWGLDKKPWDNSNWNEVSN